MSGSAGLTETDSGLVVPSHAVKRPQQTWQRDDVKHLRRFLRFTKDHQLLLVLACSECKQTLVEDATHTLLRCKCRDRILPAPLTPNSRANGSRRRRKP